MPLIVSQECHLTGERGSWKTRSAWCWLEDIQSWQPQGSATHGNSMSALVCFTALAVLPDELSVVLALSTPSGGNTSNKIGSTSLSWPHSLCMFCTVPYTEVGDRL